MISLFGALQEGVLEEVAFIKPDDDIVDYGAKDFKTEKDLENPSKQPEGCGVTRLESKLVSPARTILHVKELGF